ncbi:MAG: alpha/beta fold hydrolase [Acidobacteriota bacterium]
MTADHPIRIGAGCGTRSPKRATSLALLVLTVACATASPPAVTAPPRDGLEEFLRTSPDARAIGDAARAEGLLNEAESNLPDLETVAQSLGIESIAQLAPRVTEVVGESTVLFAALDERRRGGRTGDTAHWVAVALLALDPREPAESSLSAIEWQPDYLQDVLALRQLHREGKLSQVAVGPIERQPEDYRMTLAPRIEAAQRPVFRAREATGYWPVFAGAGERAIVGTVALQRDETVVWDELRVLVRRPGSARVLTAPEPAPTRFELGDDGALTAAGSTPLERDQELAVLVQLPGISTFVETSSGALLELPWGVGCCQFLERPDTEWWVRLSDGPATGAWLLASADEFRAGHPALEQLAQRQVPGLMPDLTIGSLQRAGRLDVFGGARLSYWLRGTPGAPALLVVHGGPGLGSQYLQQPLIDVLGDSRLLLFYDQRGSGYSQGGDDPGLLTLERAAIDLDQIRRAAGLERIDILAHSFGGLVAIRYALDYPQHVGRLLLVDPDPATRAEWETFRERTAARTTPEDAARIQEIAATPGWQDDPMLVGTVFALRMRAYVASPLPPEQRISVPFNEVTLPNFVTTPAIVRANLGDWDLRDLLGRIAAPTLIIAGGDSVFPLSAMQELAEGIPGARLEVIDDVGHFPFLEAPDEFATQASEFLR